MPFEEPVEIARILESEAESDLLDRDIHLLEAHTGILYHSVVEEGARRMACIAHADRMEPVLGHAEGVRIAPDAPMLAIPELNELPELLEHVVASAAKARLSRCIASGEAPDMKAYES